jgi:HEAT repeat protein
VLAKDPDEQVRLSLVAALPPGDPLREIALGDPDPGVRLAAMEHPDQPAGGELSVPALGQVLVADPWPAVRVRAAVVLAERGHDGHARDLLTGAVASDGDDEVRRTALTGLVSVGDPRAPALLFSALEDRRGGVPWRRFAAGQLGATRDPRHAARLAQDLPILIKQAEDDEDLVWVAAACATALGRLADPAATRALLAAAADPALWPVQTAALEALGEGCPAAGQQVVRDVIAAGSGQAVAAARRTRRKCGY